jgi:DNA-binding GntR family transcriptional regulator
MQNGSQSDTQFAYTEIRSRILDGRFLPGHQISPRSMIEQLSIGHTPIRGAIQRLVVEGLLEVVPKKGTFVTAPSQKDLRHIFEVRLGLESTAAYLAAIQGSTAGLDEAAERLNRLLESEHTDLWTEQHIGWTFHQELFAASKNDRLLANYKMLRVQTGLALNELDRHDATTVRRGTKEHLRIYAAIKSKDPESARRHMWNHILDGTDTRIKLIRGEHE